MIEMFFDCSSPWTYLAFHNLQPLAQQLGETIRWRPILVGGIFNSVNPSVYESRQRPVPAKQDYLRKDLHDWARLCELPIRFPPSIFPINSVKAMRACIVLDARQQLVRFARAVFQSYWERDEDITQDAVLTAICTSLDIDAGALLQAIAQPAIKEQLRLNTEELIRRGGFGSPTIFVQQSDMYFGNDRLPLVRAAVLRARGSAIGH